MTSRGFNTPSASLDTSVDFLHPIAHVEDSNQIQQHFPYPLLIQMLLANSTSQGTTKIETLLESATSIEMKLGMIKRHSNDISRLEAFEEFRNIEDELKGFMLNRKNSPELQKEDCMLYYSIINIISRTYLIHDIQPWLVYAEERIQGLSEEKYLELYIQIYDTKSDMLRQMGGEENYKLSQEYIEKAQNLLSRYHKTSGPLISYVCTHKGEFHYRKGQFEESKKAFESSLANLHEWKKNMMIPFAASNQETKRFFQIMQIIDRMTAFCYMQMTQLYIAWGEEKVDEAEKYLKLCYEEAEKLKTCGNEDNYKFFRGRSLCHEGLILKNKEKLEEGRKLLAGVLPEGHYLDRMYKKQFDEIIGGQDEPATPILQELTDYDSDVSYL